MSASCSETLQRDRCLLTASESEPSDWMTDSLTACSQYMILLQDWGMFEKCECSNLDYICSVCKLVKKFSALIFQWNITGVVCFYQLPTSLFFFNVVLHFPVAESRTVKTHFSDLQLSCYNCSHKCCCCRCCMPVARCLVWMTTLCIEWFPP